MQSTVSTVAREMQAFVYDTAGRLEIQAPGSKPILTLTGDDALSEAQRSGLTREQAIEAATVALHGAQSARRTVAELREVTDPSWPPE